MKFETLEERFDNWGFTVRLPKFQSGECAAWAKLFVAMRDAKDVPSNITPVEKDGWLVEAAWSAMPNHTHKWMLKYTYIMRLSPEQVAIRMRRNHNIIMRGVKFEIVMADAERALAKSIAAISSRDFLKYMQKRTCKPEISLL